MRGGAGGTAPDEKIAGAERLLQNGAGEQNGQQADEGDALRGAKREAGLCITYCTLRYIARRTGVTIVPLAQGDGHHQA